MRRANAARMSGSSVHVWLASEIGLRIVRGDYPPGTILPNEAKWSETFDVSRSAVREAIKMLMAKSLLASRPKVGSWVEPKERWNLLDRDVLSWYAALPDGESFLRTVQEFRHIIEPEAAAFAAERHTDAQMGEISQACLQMAQSVSLQERTLSDTQFHLAILRASGNDLLVPLGVLIEVGTPSSSHVRHSRNTGPTACADASRRDREEHPPASSAAARDAVRKLLANTDKGIGRSRR